MRANYDFLRAAVTIWICFRNVLFWARFIAPVLWPARGAPYSGKPPALEKARARGTPGVQAHSSLRKSAQECANQNAQTRGPPRHRGLSKSVNCRKSAGPPASRARCFEVCTAPTPVGRPFVPTAGDPLPGSRAFTAWTAGPLRRISSEASFPATAPRPASEDAVQTPLDWSVMGI